MGVVNIINDGEKEPAAGSTPADKQGDNKGQSNKPYLGQFYYPKYYRNPWF